LGREPIDRLNEARMTTDRATAAAGVRRGMIGGLRRLALEKLGRTAAIRRPAVPRITHRPF